MLDGLTIWVLAKETAFRFVAATGFLGGTGFGNKTPPSPFSRDNWLEGGVIVAEASGGNSSEGVGVGVGMVFIDKAVMPVSSSTASSKSVGSREALVARW
jgi:hypothetical protein